MRLVIDFDGGKTLPSVSKKTQPRLPFLPNDWWISILTGAMVVGMVVPQFSVVLKSTFSIRDITQSTTVTTGVTKYRLPVAGGVPMTSGYGWRIHPITGTRKFHAGIDFGAAQGQPIYAAAGGVVVFAGEKGGYGNTIKIKHTDQESTLYGHASALLVSAGSHVVQGQLIARVGSTGYSTGPHLHFEVHVDGEHTDPRPFLKQLR